MINDIIASFNRLEKDLHEKLIEPERGYALLDGTVPILLSAPHSVVHMREGKLKPAERRTASLITYLHEQTNSFALYKTINFDDDANFDVENYYKDTAVETIKSNKIKLMLDFHIMSPERESNIDIGTGNGKNIFNRKDILELMLQKFKNNSINLVRVDDIFKALSARTMSAYISERCEIPCFQIEINWRLLNEKSSENRIIELIDSLIQIIIDSKDVL